MQNCKWLRASAAAAPPAWAPARAVPAMCVWRGPVRKGLDLNPFLPPRPRPAASSAAATRRAPRDRHPRYGLDPCRPSGRRASAKQHRIAAHLLPARVDTAVSSVPISRRCLMTVAGAQGRPERDARARAVSGHPHLHRRPHLPTQVPAKSSAGRRVPPSAFHLRSLLQSQISGNLPENGRKTAQETATRKRRGVDVLRDPRLPGKFSVRTQHAPQGSNETGAASRLQRQTRRNHPRRTTESTPMEKSGHKTESRNGSRRHGPQVNPA